MRGRRTARALAVVGLFGAWVAPAAHAQSSEVQRAALKIFQDYATDGVIDPCRHTSKELKLALDNIPPDIEQYASEYPGAIEAAIESRARGDCAGKKPATGLIPRPTATSTPTPVPTPVETAVPTKTVVPDPPQPDTAATSASSPAPTTPDRALERVAAARPSNDAPFPLLLLGVLLALCALIGLTLATMRRFGIAEDRLAPAAHAWREATWRLGGTWADFRDWVRTGR